MVNMSDGLPAAPEITPTPDEEALAEGLRDGMMVVLSPLLINDDTFSRMLGSTLRKMLKRCTLDELLSVLNHAQRFIDEMDPYRAAIEASRNADAERLDASVNAQADGQGRSSGNDSVRQVNADEVSHRELLSTELETYAAAEDTTGRYEATLAGNESDNGFATEASLP
jgi:hypothetical protein